MTTKQRIFLGSLAYWAFICPMVLGQDAPLAKKINEAIDKGVVYLKNFSEDGDKGSKRPASWALRGWSLLETGVSPTDDTVKKVVEYVRREVPNMDRVYDLALSLILLDKLGDPADDPLIESLAVRLLVGQSYRGGWTYEVDLPHLAERTRLAKLILDMETLRSHGLAIKFRPRSPLEIAQDVTRQIGTIQRTEQNVAGDNSNTQFAMIAVWVARRHGVPVVNSMAQVERRFQVSQVKSGAWGYQFPINSPPEDDTHYSHPAMTCAGLLGLALGQGVRAHPRNLMEDEQVQRALEVVAQGITGPGARKSDNFNYFLFSLERMAVVYNLKKIADQDWYLWGAQKLVESQGLNGSWLSGLQRDAADTCFALLFLKRANVAQDLTVILEAPIRKGPPPVIRKSDPNKIPDNLFDPPKLVPK